MADWFLETGLHLLVVALIPAIGLLLVRSGLWGDRSKGRPRCPKCWYDMRGHVPGASATSGTTHVPEGVVTPLLICSQCGHDARTLRELYKNRRRSQPLALGIIALSIGLPLLWSAINWVPRDAVVRAIRRASGTVEFHGRGSSDINIYTGALLPPLHPCVSRAKLASPPATSDRWRALTRLPYLMYLDLRGSSITDADLADLKPVLRHLRSLDLSQTHITDQGLAQLSGPTDLIELDLSETAVTGQGFQHLENLTHLTWLRMSGTPVTDDDLVHLQGLTGLIGLALANTSVTDAGLIHLEAIPYVEPQNTTGTAITPEGIRKLMTSRRRQEARRRRSPDR